VLARNSRWWRLRQFSTTAHALGSERKHQRRGFNRRDDRNGCASDSVVLLAPPRLPTRARMRVGRGPALSRDAWFSRGAAASGRGRAAKTGGFSFACGSRSQGRRRPELADRGPDAHVLLIGAGHDGESAKAAINALGTRRRRTPRSSASFCSASGSSKVGARCAVAPSSGRGLRTPQGGSPWLRCGGRRWARYLASRAASSRSEPPGV